MTLRWTLSKNQPTRRNAVGKTEEAPSRPLISYSPIQNPHNNHRIYSHSIFSVISFNEEGNMSWSDYRWEKMSAQTFNVDLWIKSSFFFHTDYWLLLNLNLKMQSRLSLHLIFYWPKGREKEPEKTLSQKFYRRSSSGVHGMRSVCHTPARLNHIMPENNKTSAAGATAWGKETDPYEQKGRTKTQEHKKLKMVCFLWTLRQWEKKKGRQLLQSTDCSSIVTGSFSSSSRKAPENYCGSSKLLFPEQLGVALGWEDH